MKMDSTTKKPDKNVSITSFNDASDISILHEKKRESTMGPFQLRTNPTDHKMSGATSVYDGRKVNQSPKDKESKDNFPNKQMSGSDVKSFDHNNSLANTEKEIASPTSPLKKMMGTMTKIGKGIGSGIGSLGKNLGSVGNKSLNMIGNIGSALKLKELARGLNVVSKGLGLNSLGKGLGAMGKQGLKGLNNLSKGLGLDSLGKGLNNLSKLGLDQLGKGLKDISKGLNLRKLQENLKKIAYIIIYFCFFYFFLGWIEILRIILTGESTLMF